MNNAARPVDQPVSPYLTIKRAKQALLWYEKVFDAEVISAMPAEDGERLMHATIIIAGGKVMLSDEFPEWSNFEGPQTEPISPVAISVTLKTAEAVDRMYELALKNNAQSSWPPEDMFWGDRFCQIIDPFNHRWMLTAPLAEADA